MSEDIELGPWEILIPDELLPLYRDICGCGSGEWAKVVLDVLEAAALSKTRDWIGEDPVRELVAHVLGSFRVDLLEHGTSVYGSWLTEKGKTALPWLREHVYPKPGYSYVGSDEVVYEF